MRTKMVKRHWCDFCNKAMFQAHAMDRHEKHCTLNPQRECRVCKALEDGQDSGFNPVPLAQLVAMLPAMPCMFPNGLEHGEYFAKLESAIKDVRAASGNCPACIMAALRQAKIPVPLVVEWFDFTAEMKEIWRNVNDARRVDYAY